MSQSPSSPAIDPKLFPDTPPMLREYWYTACATSQLAKEPRGVRVLDQDLVVFRDGAGQARALLDRCCHRGVRLSLGSVTKGNIACRYHGWCFDGEGRCVHIPSLTKDRRIPEKVGVPSFPCEERDGYVWVFLGEGAPPPLEGIPRFASRRWMQGAMDMRCDYLKMIENNVDVCHPYFAHPWTHFQFFTILFRGFQEYEYEMRVTERGIVVFTPATSDPEAPIPPDAMMATYELPNRVTVETTKFHAPIIILHFVPTGENSCRLEWMVTNPMPFGPKVGWSKQEPKIFAQDRILLESAQPWYDRGGGTFERSVEADASSLLVRRVVELAARGAWESTRASLPKRRLVGVRA
ncbi:Rieske 2Fe-2S domain-containing protein [Sorangium sp. So ce233]|uniref:Rieske 2Fe-2S domain-containing protein n=1 Tax=Sorangium sp. So ce233 TaxID=3133290 RepID=UPI003F5E198E